MKLTAPETFRKNGFDYELIIQHPSQPFALYRQKFSSGGIAGYELHRLRWKPEREVWGKVFQAGVHVASNEEFGVYAWAYDTLSFFLLNNPEWRGLLEGVTE